MQKEKLTVGKYVFLGHFLLEMNIKPADQRRLHKVQMQFLVPLLSGSERRDTPCLDQTYPPAPGLLQACWIAGKVQDWRKRWPNHLVLL